MKKIIRLVMLILAILVLASCSAEDIFDAFFDETEDVNQTEENTLQVVSIDDLKQTEHFKNGSLEHILEGEINRKGQAVGFHYDGLPSKKGKVISGTETKPNEYGIYEAGVEVSDVKKTSNRGLSSFFPKEWTAQEVVDAINEAYENNSLITGNTYEGLTEEGQVIRMYLDQNDKIISAFPVY